MVTRQPHHEYVHNGEDAENHATQDGVCGDVAAYVLGVLDPAQQKIFAQHLAGCEGCQRDAADFGVFAPVLRQCAGPPAPRRPCRITRSILMLAACFVFAVAAVVSVVESLASHVDGPAEVGDQNRALIQMAYVEPFVLFRHR